MEFQLAPWETSFAQSIAFHANNEKIAANLRDGFPFPYTYDDAVQFIEACMAQGDGRQLFRAIVVDGNAAGSIGITLQENIYRKSAELGYWLGEAYWGKSIMTHAVKQICEEAFRTYDIIRIFAEPFAYNTGSRRVLEKAGFSLEGTMRKGVFKNGKYFDYCIYAMLKE